MNDVLMHIGLPSSLVKLFRSNAGKNPHRFVLPVSLIDLSKRDEEYKIATQAKIAAEIAIINEAFPKATIEILIGDTLKEENGGLDAPELIKQWADFLQLPLHQLSPDNKSVEAVYRIQHQFPGLLSPDHIKVMVSSWRHYQTPEVTDLMKRVHQFFKQLTRPDQLMDDELLFNQHNLGFVHKALEEKLKTSLGFTDTNSQMFQDLLHGFSFTAIHHLKKTHKIELEEATLSGKSTLLKDPNVIKKTNIFNELPAETRIKEFENAFCYILQEFFVILDILVTFPNEQHVSKKDLLWMLYTSGSTDVPKTHPVIQLNAFLSLFNMARKFIPCAEFKIQNNERHTSSNGEQTMLRKPMPTQSPPQHILKTVTPPPQGDNNSPAATAPASSNSRHSDQTSLSIAEYSSDEDAPSASASSCSEAAKTPSDDGQVFQLDEHQDTLPQEKASSPEVQQDGRLLKLRLTQLCIEDRDPDTLKAALDMWVHLTKITQTSTKKILIHQKEKPPATKQQQQNQPAEEKTAFALNSGQ